MASNEANQSPRNITMTVGGVQANLTCLGFHIWAEDFLAAARMQAKELREAVLKGD